MGLFSDRIYCAFCRLERRILRKKDAGWTNVLFSFIAATGLMWFFWQGIDGRVVVLFMSFLVASQILVRLRWRMSLPCPHCGFDPLLYKTDKGETVRRVKTKLAQVKASGKYMFKSQNPFEHLPIVYVENPKAMKLTAKPSGPASGQVPAQAKKADSRLLSRQV